MVHLIARATEAFLSKHPAGRFEGVRAGEEFLPGIRVAASMRQPMEVA